ncbi:MAG: efflux RND transporter periplasmic adaptor subunit [Desulfobacterales bacterium]|jgi:RND family efflux transporter MFP subunit
MDKNIWTRHKIIRLAIIFIPIVFAIFLFGSLVMSRKEPEKLPQKEKARAVRIIRMQLVEFIPRAVGYGTVEPDQVWNAVAEVSGKVVETSTLLEKGAFCRPGETLIRVAPEEYHLVITQMEADIQETIAQLAELKRQEQNLKASLKIEEKTLELIRRELERNKKLFKRRVISSSEYERQEQVYNTQLTKIQNLKNSLKLIPANRRKLNAKLSSDEARLKDAKLDLEYTTIQAPFDCRISAVKVEKGQFVSRGEVLATADGTRVVEITGQFPIDKLINVFRNDAAKMPSDVFKPQEIREIHNLTPVVRFSSGDFSTFWEARFVRSDATIDPVTRTVGIIVAVDNPYKHKQQKDQPPLVRGMFCEVEIKGRKIPNVLVIPRMALHAGYVFVIGQDERLVRKPVEIDFTQSNLVVIKLGLQPGDKVVVSDLIPAIEGMLLEPVVDEKLELQLVAEARGNTPIK